MLIKWFIVCISGGDYSLVSKKGGLGENFFFFRLVVLNWIKVMFMCMCILFILV